LVDHQELVVAKIIVTVLGPGGIVNRFSSPFCRKPPDLGPGIIQLPLQGIGLSFKFNRIFPLLTAGYFHIKEIRADLL
jgi:hypothetical protein